MADLDQDGCEFDEDGIYREKSFSGIYIDNDGIWCEEGERLGHYTGRDSGLGATDRKSSSSTLNRLPIELDHEYNDGTNEVQPPIDKKRQPQDSLADQSLNISEYEESDTGSCGQELVRSAEELDFPELDEYSDVGSENGAQRIINRSSRNYEYEYESVHSQEYEDEVFSSGGGNEAESKKPDDFSIYLTTSHGPSTLHADLQREPSLLIGESLFTQDDPDPDQVQSLREFEQLEQLALGGDGDHVNLIGAYLKGMENQEMMEDPSLLEYRENRFDNWERKRLRKDHRALTRATHVLESNELDDSVIENEVPPFGVGDSINFSSLDMSNNDMLRSGQSGEQSTKIPMLRNRSPSMSRPGSASSRPRSRPGSRPVSRTEVLPHPDDQRARQPFRRKSPERRSLPATPQMSDSSRSNSQDRGSRRSSIIRVDGSPDGRNRRSPAHSPGRILPIPSQEQTEREDAKMSSDDTDEVLHQAAELLLHGSNAGYLDGERSQTRSGKTTPKETQSHSRLSPGSKTSPAKQNSSTNQPKVTPKSRQRPFSAEVNRPNHRKPPFSNSRPATPNSFKIRSSSVSGTGLKPVKALHVNESIDATRSSTDLEESEDTSVTGSKAKNELKNKFLTEKSERKQKEQTLKQLQQEYHSLLQKYAEAENTIDSLRIGAKIPIAIELTSIGGSGQQGQGDRRTSVVSVPPAGLQGNHMGSMVSLASASAMIGFQGSKQVSRAPSVVSMTSGKVVPSLQGQGQNQGQGQGHEGAAPSSGSSDADSAKMTLLAGARAVEEQTNVFEALMREQKLSLDEQELVLVNVKSGYEALQQNFRDAKDEFLLKKRQRRGSSVSSESGFDDDKTVEGELYKLGMKLDELEHGVQENMKEKHKMRRPFQGPAPVKGDHGVGGGSVSSLGPSGPRRQFSSMASSKVGSSSSIGAGSEQFFVAGSVQGSIEEKLGQVEQEYAGLMEGYHRLKQMKQTPERDIHINDLLDNLRGVYDTAPSHLRLPPPPDSPSRGPSPEPNSDEQVYQQDTAKMEEAGPDSDMNSDRIKGYSSSLASSDRRSERFSARNSDRLSIGHSDKFSDRRSGRHSDRMSARLSDARLSDAKLSDRFSARDKLSDRHATPRSKGSRQGLQEHKDQESSYESASESVRSAIFSRKSSLPSQQGRGSAGVKRRDTLSKDSGYIGSEISRKTPGTPDKSRQHSYANSRKSSRATVIGERSPPVQAKTIPSPLVQRSNSLRHPAGSGEEATQNRRHSRPKSAGSGIMKNKNMTSNYSQVRSETPSSSSEEDRQSCVSKTPTARSVKSEQLQTLMDEVDALKKVMGSRKTLGDSQANTSVNASATQGVSADTSYGVTPGYYYYVPQGQVQSQVQGQVQGKENHPVDRQPANVSYSVPQNAVYAAQPQVDQTYPKVPVNDSSTWQHYTPHYNYDYAHPPESTAYTYSKLPPSDVYDHYHSSQRRRRSRPKSEYNDGRRAHRTSNRHLSPRRYKREDRGYNSDEDYRTDQLREYYLPQPQINEQERAYNTSTSYPYQNYSYQPNPNMSASGTAPNAAKPPCPTCHGQGQQTQQTVIPAQPQYAYQVPNQGTTLLTQTLPSQPSVPTSQNQPTFLTYAQPTEVPATILSHSQPGYITQSQPILTRSLPQVSTQTATVVSSALSGATNSALHTSYVPVQVLPANATILKVLPEKGQSAKVKGRKTEGQGHSKKSTSRVRYYIKEYKEEPRETTQHKRRSTHTSRKASKSKVYESLSEEDSDSEQSGIDLNDSLEHALETARELKKISRTLKSGLKKELSHSLGDIFS